MVTVHPPLVGFLDQARADQLAVDGFFGDDPPGLAAAWTAICDRWDDAVERATMRPEASLHEQVDGEWSFVETLRHLVFVTDVWVGEVVDEHPAPHHPLGLPPDFAAEVAVPAFGLDVAARPSLAEVLAVRAERRAQVDRAIGEQTPESLLRTSAARDGRFQVVGALQTVLFEEWAHLQYAERDLAALGR